MMRRGRAAGFTLVELIVFIAIVTVGLLGVLAAFLPSVRGSADPLVGKQVLNIAESTLREVLLRNFENDPADPENDDAALGCTINTTPRCQPNNPIERANYNDVDDYNSYDQTGVRYIDGVTPVAGLEGYRVQIAVAPSTLHDLAGVSMVKQVTVTVTGGGESIALTGYRTKYD